jgi:hypothetical protein
MTDRELELAFASLPDGWLTRNEALLLVKAAERTTGTIVEVGSYYGRSACLLARLGRPLVCVDPWADCGEFVYGPGTTGDKVFAAFNVNIAALGYAAMRRVTICRTRVEDWTPVPAGLVYLDGDHTYEGTIRQIEKAFLCNPAIIAVHDVNDGGGGRLIKKACVELLGPWAERVERLAVWDNPARWVKK